MRQAVILGSGKIGGKDVNKIVRDVAVTFVMPDERSEWIFRRLGEVVVQANADTFLMAVAVAASCAFLTPIGHKNNIIIMGPGGYRFGDYWRMGLPLELLVIAVGVPTILYVWPL